MKNVLILLLGSIILGSWGSYSYADIAVSDGFQADLWLSGTGELRGVTVGRGGAFGNGVFVGNISTDSILRLTGKNTFETFASGLNPGGSYKMAIDYSGLYGGDMYVNAPNNEGGKADPIYRISSSGNVSLFFNSSSYDLMTNGIAFGNGLFGNSMYVQDVRHGKLLQISPTGGIVNFASYSPMNDWEADLVISNNLLLGNNAYGSGGHVISPDGIVSTFPRPANVALAVGEGVFGEYLFIGTSFGEIYKYSQNEGLILFASGFSGRIRDIDIAYNNMWLTVSETGELYKISVPEPVTLSLLAIGGLLLRRRK